MGWIAETWRGIMAPEPVTGAAPWPTGEVGKVRGVYPDGSLKVVFGGNRAPSREAFLAWREHPVTLFAFAALARAAKEQEAAWAGTSWEGGFADQNLLNELRVRADAYNSMQEADYLGFCEWAGVEPKDGENSTT